MSAPQGPQGPNDRISTREELHQVLDVLLTARDPRVSAEEVISALPDVEVDSQDPTAVLWCDAEEASTDLLDDMFPLAELFPADHARVVN